MVKDVTEAPVPEPFDRESLGEPIECTHGSSHAHMPPPFPTDGMSKRERDFYQHLRRTIRAYLAKRGSFKYAELLLVGPDLFHLLCRLATDPRIPAFDKAKLVATIAYFISPVGLVPEVLTGPIGYVDDIALAAFVLNGLLNSDSAPIVREHWAGDQDVLAVVQGVLEVAESAISGGLWQRIKGVRLPFGRSPSS